MFLDPLWYRPAMLGVAMGRRGGGRSRSIDEAALQKMLAACEERGLKAIIGIEEDKPEDIADFIRFGGMPRRNQQEFQILLIFVLAGVGVYTKSAAQFLSSFRGENSSLSSTLLKT